MTFGAQQRYFSYRAILVAIVSQNNFAFFMGVSHYYRAIRCKMGYCTDVSVWSQVPRAGIAPFWGSADLPEKVSRDMGYRSDSIAISRNMGSLSLWLTPFTGASECQDQISTPTPQPQNSLVRIAVCNQLSRMEVLSKERPILGDKN